MTHTVTILTDHKGVARPKANGDEYIVDALLDITSYGSTAIAPVGNFTASANTFARTGGDAITSLEVGQQVTLTNCVDGGNNTTVTVSANDGTTLTLSAVAADETGDTITVTNTNEILSATSFGLSTITQLTITGKEDKTYDFFPRVESDGTYLTSSKVELKAVTAASSAEVATTTNVGSMRVRIHGLI